MPLDAGESLPGSRAEALASGVLYYYTGKRCSRGHYARRFASSGSCTECGQDWRARRRSDREKRKRLDDVRYMTGRPCIRGHIAPRLYSNGNCTECNREKYAAKQARYKDAQNARNRERYANDPEYRARIQAKKTPAHQIRASAKKRERYNTDAEYRKHVRDVEAAWRKSHPEKTRGHQLKVHYGLSLTEYTAMLEAQGGVCAICKRKPDQTLHVDHDHHSPTGRVRGLLCRQCNRGLGHFEDDPIALRAAAVYLEGAGCR